MMNDDIERKIGKVTMYIVERGRICSRFLAGAALQMEYDIRSMLDSGYVEDDFAAGADDLAPRA